MKAVPVPISAEEDRIGIRFQEAVRLDVLVEDLVIVSLIKQGIKRFVV